MKRFVICLLSLILLIGCCGCKSGTDSTASNDDKPAVTANPATDFEYAFVDDHIVINRYIGSDESVVIPSEIDGKPVTKIGMTSFMSTDVQKVVIPDSVDEIWENAFSNCTKLTEVEFGSSIKYIGYQAFRHCTALEKANLPKKLETIHNYAFYECTSLKEVTIPKTVVSIGSPIFYDAKALTSVTFEDGLLCLSSEGMFMNCPLLESVTIPASVKQISGYIFAGCPSLKNIYFEGDAPKVIDSEVFGEPNKNIVVNYKKGTVGWDNPSFNSYTLKETAEVYERPQYTTDFGYAINNGAVTVTDYYADAENVVIPEKIEGLPVTEIGPLAFFASGIKSVTIPDTVEIICESAFMCCNNLTEVQFGKNVCDIKDKAFYKCSALVELDLPERLESVGSRAFSECSSVKEVTIPKTLTSWGSSAFARNTSLVSLAFEEGLIKIGNYAFRACSSLETVTIPASVVDFSDMAFDDCDNLKSVYIEGVKFNFIGLSVFGDREDVTVYLHDGAPAYEFDDYQIKIW